MRPTRSTRDADPRRHRRPAQPFRLARAGCRPRHAARFTFDGQTLRGHPGDTLASALLANGVRLVGRSFKYHRPRGILSAGPEEPNALVELRTARGANPTPGPPWPSCSTGSWHEPEPLASLRFDLMGVNQLAGAGLRGRLLLQDLHVARLVLGEGLRAADPPRRGPRPRCRAARPGSLRQGDVHCDVLVIGAGPAGLMAALAAAAPGRAWSCARRTSAWAAGCWRSAARSTADRRSTGSRPWRPSSAPPRLPHPDAHERLRRLRRRLRRRRARRRPPRRARPASAAPAALAHRRRAPSWPPARSSGRSCSATTTGPASCWPARCGPTSTASAWRPAAAPWCSPTTTTRPGPCRTSRRRRRGRGARRRARRRAVRLRRGRPRVLRCWRVPPSPACAATWRSTPSR